MMKLCKTSCPTLPVVTKCCFCIPVRKGVLLSGYVSLVLTAFELPLPLLNVMVFSHFEIFRVLKLPDSPDPVVQGYLMIVFAIIGVIKTIVMLVGAHKKKKSLLKIYFYFAIVFELTTVFIDFQYYNISWEDYTVNIIYFSSMALDIYELFLVNSVIRLIEGSSEVQYEAYQEQCHLSV